jgi:hypothetical protein
VHDCIKAGLLAGGQYVFVAPSDGEIAVVRTELANLSPGAPSAVRVIEVPEAEFRKAAVTDYFVINPDSDEHEVFLELPLGAKSAPFWIQVNDNRAAAGFVARFRELIEKYAHTSDELTLAR